MPNTDRRGELTQRVGTRSERATTKVHYVDSEVADDVLTFCGRRMALKTAQGKLIFFNSYVTFENMCQSCGEGALAEPA
jgi:hypothetical protein